MGVEVITTNDLKKKAIVFSAETFAFSEGSRHKMQHEMKDRTIDDVAIEKSHEYAQRMERSWNTPVSRALYAEVKEAYRQGFLKGFAHKMGGGHD